MIDLPNNLIDLIVNDQILSLKDVCNLTTTSRAMHNTLLTLLNTKLAERHAKIYACDRFPSYCHEPILVSDFVKNHAYELNVGWEIHEVNIYIDSDDKIALERLCNYINKKYPVLRSVSFRVGTCCREGSSGEMMAMTDELLLKMASRAQIVSMGQCHAITLAGLSSLTECQQLSVFANMQFGESKSTLSNLIFQHSLLVIHDKFLCKQPKELRDWLHMLHDAGIIRLVLCNSVCCPTLSSRLFDEVTVPVETLSAEADTPEKRWACMLHHMIALTLMCVTLNPLAQKKNVREC